jgi:hypothetical protein
MTNNSSSWHSSEGFDYLSPTEKRFQLIHHFRQQTYFRTEAGWKLGGNAYTFEPIVGRLDNDLASRLRAEDMDETDPADLVRRAWFAQSLGHHDRVVALTIRALRSLTQLPDTRRGGAIVPECWQAEAVAAAAMLCSARRQLKESQRGLEESSPFDDGTYAPLMTSRAAALCDVGRWDEAHRLATAARSVRDSDAVSLLLRRIDAHLAEAVPGLR